MAATVNIKTYSDAGFSRRFKYADGEGTGIVLTTGTMRMVVRRKAEEEEIILDTDRSDHGSIAYDVESDGEFILTLKQTHLARIAAGTYVHSLIWSPSGNQPVDIWRGTLTHEIGPTR